MPGLARPVKVKTLLSAAEAYQEIGEATVDLRHPAVVRHEKKLARKLRQEAMLDKKKVTRKHLTVLCSALDIELTAERQAEMESMDSEALERLLEAIGAQRRWPDEVKYEQSMEDLTLRARVMAAGGVSRIFILLASDHPAANAGVVDEMAHGAVAQRHPAIERRLEELARRHLVALCNVLEIEMTAERCAAMESMDSDGLQRLARAIVSQRRWPMGTVCEIPRRRGEMLQEDGMDDLYASFGIEMTPERRAAVNGANGTR